MTTTFSDPASQTLLAHLTSSPPPTTSVDTISDPSPILPTVFSRSREQARHAQECLYRMGAGVTMFEVRDPDPYAVDKGRVFGVRIEVFVGGEFVLFACALVFVDVLEEADVFGPSLDREIPPPLLHLPNPEPHNPPNPPPPPTHPSTTHSHYLPPLGLPPPTLPPR
jgi:hypothetical protein